MVYRRDDPMLKNISKCIIPLISILFFLSCSTSNRNHVKSDQEQKAELYYDYGTKYLVDRDYTKALTNLRKALSFSENDSKIHNNLGMAYFFKKNMDKALFHLKKSVELDKKNSDARNNLASIYFYQKKYKQAYQQYLIVLKNLEYNQQYRTHYNLALIDLKFKRYQKALTRLGKSVKENPDYCPAHYQLGLYNQNNGQLNQALEHYNNGTKGVCLNNPAPHFQKSLVLIKLGKDQKALFSLRSIMERFPKSRYSILAKRKLQSLNINKFRHTKNAKRDIIDVNNKL